MRKFALFFALLVPSVHAQTGVGACTASASGSTTAAAEINNKACATETWTVGTGGVTANTLVILDSSALSKVVAATSATNVYGVAVTTVSAAGSVQVQRQGQISVVMENNFTAGDLAIQGTSTYVDARDSGYVAATGAASIASTTRIIGVILTTGSASATATIALSPFAYGTMAAAGALFAAEYPGVWNGSAWVNPAWGTVYHNTFSVPIMVGCGGFSNYGQVSTSLFIGPTSTPTILAGNGTAQTWEQGLAAGIVPAGYYYEFLDQSQPGGYTANNFMCLGTGTVGGGSGFGITLK